MSDLIHAVIDGGVGQLRLTRAGKRNALNGAMVAQALAAMDGFVAAGVRVAVLSADQPVFCSGNDLSEVPERVEDAIALAFIEALVDRPLFWVAAVSGPALGAGVAMVAVCPVSIATETAWFGLPELQIGLFPAGIVPYLEPLLGPRAAFRAGLTGAPLPAADAVTAGLIDEVVAPDALDGRVQARVEELLLRPAVTDAARQAWQAQFRTPSFLHRFDQMRQVLRTHERDVPVARGDR
jgi:enoyl-CoA hydratase/carnithine racemase